MRLLPAVWQHRRVPPERDELEETVERRDDRGDRLVAEVERRGRTVGHTPDDGRTTELCRRAQTGDSSAREELIDVLLPLVSALARRYRTEGLDQTDLVQEGIVGLLRAIDRYDTERGVPFAAYATFWIRQALQDARSDFIRPFRLPPKALQQLSRLKSEHQRIYQREQRSAGVAELADRTRIDLAQAEALVVADHSVRSLDEHIETGGGHVGTLGDLLEDPLSATAYEDVIDTVAGEQLHALLSRLSERERAVVRARFGFDGTSERLVDIGERLGISAERVRQIEERALAKLRHA
jgi:RNA polymerase primary sigma factor